MQRFLSKPFMSRRFYWHPGSLRLNRRNDSRLQEILDGKHDEVAEGSFYMKGGIDMIKE
jgi:F-type H+-transporting ATPase subunit beta